MLVLFNSLGRRLLAGGAFLFICGGFSCDARYRIDRDSNQVMIGLASRFYYLDGELVHQIMTTSKEHERMQEMA